MKAGDCIVSYDGFYYREGVLLNSYKNNSMYKHTDILWFVEDIKNHEYSFEIERDKPIFHIEQDIKKGDIEIAPVPHFCRVDNVYDVLSKMIPQEKQAIYGTCFKIYGIEDKYYSNDETHYYSIILKTEEEKFIQIMCSTYSIKNVTDDIVSYVYIREISTENEFKINSGSDIYIPKYALTLYEVKQIKPDCSEWLINNHLFCTRKNLYGFTFQVYEGYAVSCINFQSIGFNLSRCCLERDYFDVYSYDDFMNHRY